MSNRQEVADAAIYSANTRRKKHQQYLTLWSEEYAMAEEDSVIPLEAMKIVVLGSPKVGKTSLIRRYTQGEFLPSYSPTVGLEYDTKVIEVEGMIVKLHLWDTSGQTHFFGMTKKQIAEADGFVYVYDVTDAHTFKCLSSLLKKIQAIAKAPNLPKVLLGNKADLRHKQVVAPCEAKEFGVPEDMKVIEVSASSGKNVLGAFYTIALEVFKYRRLGGPRLVGSIHGVRDIVEPSDYYTHDEDGQEIENGSNYTHQFKLLMVGAPRVGKTSLRFRFCRDFYTPEYFATPGTDYDSRVVNVEGARCKVQVWDIGGDDIYDHTRRSFYKGADAFLIVYDVGSSKTFTKAEMLLKELDMYGHSEAPKILVGNKTDRTAKQAVTLEQAQEFADGWRVPEIRVSARTGENVSTVFTKLTGALKKKCATWKKVYDFS